MSGLIVHEWIEPHGGAETVVAALLRRFPEARLACAWDDTGGTFAPDRTWESRLARTVARRRKELALLPMLATWRRLPLDAEWLLCSSHLFAHHASLRRGPVPKFVYAHTPARYLWTPEVDSRGRHLAVRALAPMLTRIDRRRAQEATAIAANSAYIAERIQRCWGREATVIYPPVDLSPASGQTLTAAESEALDRLPEVFVLGASRLVPYKQVDRAIAAGDAAGVDVVIAGDGPDLARLRDIAARAHVPVHFVGRPSGPMLAALYARASVFVFGAVEDFGIMPVEAMAHGTAVVARSRGGTAETVEHGVSGILVDGDDDAEWGAAVTAAMTLPAASCRQRAALFDGATFGDRVAAWMRPWVDV